MLPRVSFGRVWESKVSIQGKIQAFLVMNRRKLYLSHAPPTLSDGQKVKLLSSLIFSKDLFDQQIPETVVAEHQGDVI